MRYVPPSRRMERTVVGAEWKDHASNVSPYVVAKCVRAAGGACGLEIRRLMAPREHVAREMCRRMSWRCRSTVRDTCVDGCGCTTHEHGGFRSRGDSSDGTWLRLHVDVERTPVVHAAPSAFNMRCVSVNRSANMSPRVTVTPVRTAHDTR
ncbi:hypothetical protein BSLA_02r0907 [Burkholderia stabilis]|nr:hypothetical protein BSLA_02r0907 [Burkholderia stabilis]